MKTTLSSAVILAMLLPMVSCGPSEQPTEAIRVGVYDTRSVAIAYAASDHNPVAAKMAELEKAKAANDTATMRELEAWGRSHQRELHRMGFGRVPVHALLAHVEDGVTALAEAKGLSAIASQCEFTSGAVEVVDVTLDLVQLYEPSEKTLKSARDIMKQPPIDLSELEKMQH